MEKYKYLQITLYNDKLNYVISNHCNCLIIVLQTILDSERFEEL